MGLTEGSVRVYVTNTTAKLGLPPGESVGDQIDRIVKVYNAFVAMTSKDAKGATS